MSASLPLDDRRVRVKDHFSMTTAIKVRVNTPNGPANVSVELAQTEDKLFSPIASSR
jgi:hypothetical protein